MSLSPLCNVGNLSPPQDVTAAALTEIELVNAAGVLFWGLLCIGADDSTSVAAINASLSINQTTKKATFTAPGSAGAAVIFQSTVGIDSSSSQGVGRDVNMALQPSWTTTFKVNVATSAGLHVVAVNEVYEQNASVGWIEEVNKAIRLVSSGGTFNAVAPWITANAGTPGGILTLTNAQSGSAVRTDTTGGTLTKVKLPAAPTDSFEVEIIDATGQWAAHSLILDGNGNSIVRPDQIGGTGTTAATFTLSVIRGSVVVKWDAVNSLYQVGVN